tara:strand:- start:9727 stop:10728 length:1002 start_codon:yes stop_codon:yes gene_type:complete
MNNLTKIGITTGDLNGVGLQLLIQSFKDTLNISEKFKLILFATKSSFEFYMKLLNVNEINYSVISNLEKSKPNQINIYECFPSHLSINPGKITSESGLAASQSLAVASKNLINNKINALVTMPVTKSNMFLGHKETFIGHTEYLRDVTQSKETLMVLLTDKLRVATATNHIPISKVSQFLTKQLLETKLTLLVNSLKKDFQINYPKVALLGLNPHMGDSGLIGEEEEKIIIPLVNELPKKNFKVSGPFSADAFFGKELYKNFDAVLSMYHDQGLIPFKMKSFNRGINFTAGMNFVRTSPDHGPALDIVGSKMVNCESFINAVYFANKIYEARN